MSKGWVVAVVGAAGACVIAAVWTLRARPVTPTSPTVAAVAVTASVPSSRRDDRRGASRRSSTGARRRSPAPPPWRWPQTEVREAPRDDDDVVVAERDRRAEQMFDAAFEHESIDEAWATTTEQAVALALADVAPRLELRSVACRTTLCRVELHGDREALPSDGPLSGVAWWVGPEQGDATLLIVREGAEIPLPGEEP